MQKVSALLLLAVLCALPGLGGPTYYQYNLAANGVANADADVPYGSNWYGMWGGDQFSKGSVNVPFGTAAKTSDPLLLNNANLQSVPRSPGAATRQSRTARLPRMRRSLWTCQRQRSS